ncbi:flagellar hook-associated protein FlgK [candidate division KSB1 bacterium]
MTGIGIRSAFNIGKKSLTAQLAGLNVTGNNIANVNTAGYSRQDLTLKPSLMINTPDGTFGMGVDIGGVRRIRDSLVDKQLRTEFHLKGQNEALERVLSQVETIINEPSETGLRSLMSEFFDDFYELANNPESITIRFNLREQAELLVKAYHRIDEQLRILSNDVDAELKATVARFNSLSKEVATLNDQISSYESVSEGTANDLRDQRDRAIDEMSETMELFAFEKDNGVVNIAAQSETIITSNYPLQFEVKTRNVNGNLVSDIVNTESQAVFTVKKGKLGGLIDSRNEIIPNFRDQLGELAGDLIRVVNNIHETGVGLQGTSLDIPKDNPFFTGSNAVNIEISRAIKDDERNIAAAQRIDYLKSDGTIEVQGAPGDNKVAMEIANLKEKLVLNNGTESLIDSFNAIVSEVGIRTREASDSVQNGRLLIDQFQNLRDATSGVSLDEEFVNLIKYQRGFQASAKVITTVEEMFESLINMV